MQALWATPGAHAIAWRYYNKSLKSLAFLPAQAWQQAYRTSGSGPIPTTAAGWPSNIHLASVHVSDASARTAAVGLDDIWGALASQGYAVTDEAAIGLPQNYRESFRDTYFNERTLRRDEGDRPVDRQRARDVIRYRWRDGDLRLREHKTITITDRADIPGKRNHSRVKLLRDPQAKAMVSVLLKLVPPDRRQPDGTFGVNLFRTFTNVVSKLHRDHEQFVVTYVLDRVGGGAETSLYEPGDVAEDGEAVAGAKAVLQRQLNPGDIIIFDDDRFRHGATPLEGAPGEMTRRDALICTVDYRETYLAAGRAGFRAAFAGIRLLVRQRMRGHGHNGPGTDVASEVEGAGAVTTALSSSSVRALVRRIGALRPLIRA